MPGRDGPVRVTVSTAANPGAIAILHLTGEVEPVLEAVTGRRGWPVGRARLVDLAGVDEGLAARLGPRTAQLMPHGGPRIVQRLVAALDALGVTPGEGDPIEVYPEAVDRYEAMALAAVARAASPAAIDLLLAQPARWRPGPQLDDTDRERSARLDRLIVPPIVVVAGYPNVGKSTLSNALLGRAMSISADAAGTTRDYTTGRIDLAGLVVDWHDTPGLRAGGDDIERHAVEIAAALMARADLLIALADAAHGWPDLPRPADLRVASKADLPGGPPDGAELSISALRGDGLDELARTVRDRLVPAADLAHPGPWVFDRRLVDEPAG